jgi:hypothetical protein
MTSFQSSIRSSNWPWPRRNDGPNQSYLIEWRIETDAEGNQHGFWCCRTPGCGGVGFGFDILPTDPDYHDDRGG